MSKARDILIASTLPSLMVEPTLNPMDEYFSGSFDDQAIMREHLGMLGVPFADAQKKKKLTTPEKRNRFVPASKKAGAKTRDNRRKTVNESRRRNRAS